MAGRHNRHRIARDSVRYKITGTRVVEGRSQCEIYDRTMPPSQKCRWGTADRINNRRVIWKYLEDAEIFHEYRCEEEPIIVIANRMTGSRYYHARIPNAGLVYQTYKILVPNTDTTIYAVNGPALKKLGVGIDIQRNFGFVFELYGRRVKICNFL